MSEEPKKILIKRVNLITEFTISEQGDQFNGAIKIGKNVKKVIGIKVITNNTGEAMRTSKRYWASITPGSIILPTDVTDMAGYGGSENITKSNSLITITVPATEKFCYAQPNRLPAPNFAINGSSGGVSKVNSLLVTDLVTGYEELYDVYESMSEELGTNTKIYIY